MAYDGMVLRAVTHELNRTLLGGRIDKIYQPLPRDLLLQIRQRGRPYQLLLSAHPAHPRVHLATEYRVQNPPEPPMFCMLLRKHLEGGRVTRIEQVGNERILIIAVENRNELGDRAERELVCEIMGRHSNIILLEPEERRIVDAIVHVSHGTSRYREVLPGRPYVAPPEQNKSHPLQVNEEQFLAKRRERPDLPLDTFLVQSFSGISPLLGRELAHRAASRDGRQEWRVFQQMMESLRQHNFTPTLVWGEKNQPLAFSCVDLTHVAGRHETMESMSRCVETFYAEKSWLDAVKQRAGDIEHHLRNEMEKKRKKLQIFRETLHEAQALERFRLYGELLTAHLHELKKGQREAVLPNFYSETYEPVTIPLDPGLSPLENAQSYFKKYNKGKKAIPIAKEQIRQTEEEMAYLEGVLQQLTDASWSELDEIREELEEQGYLKAKRKHPSGKKRSLAQPAHFRSSEGIDIYVGKNNRQNDDLTLKLAAPTDTWLHTKDLPGSHVVIRGKNLSPQTLLEAALLAAYFSKGRDSSNVPVDYTLIKHVWKPKGAKPGQVLYEKQKTLYVTPDASLIKRLQAD